LLKKSLLNAQPTQNLVFYLKIENLFKKKEDNVTFDEKSMILGYDKGTEKWIILGKFTYI
jgi:hypothetical protein